MHKLPKTVHVACSKTPSIEGSKTWDRFEMGIHKHVIDLHGAAETAKQIASLPC